MIDTGSHPVTYCLPGIAGGIYPTHHCKSTTKQNKLSSIPHASMTMTHWLQRLAMAKIAIHLMDLTPKRYSKEAEFARMQAERFIFSVEFQLWCDDAGVDVIMARKRAESILKGDMVKISAECERMRRVTWKRKLRSLKK